MFCFSRRWCVEAQSHLGGSHTDVQETEKRGSAVSGKEEKRNVQEMEPAVKESVSRIPLLKTKAGPRDNEKWTQRLKEEYMSLIKYVENNKASDNHWFQLESNEAGTRWYGTCWTYYKNEKYEFKVNFDLAVTYPQAPPEIALPELEGKTVKMYRGGKICMTTHFFPLWARNVPYFGISHALALGLGPWLSVEVPAMVEEGILKPTNKK